MQPLSNTTEALTQLLDATAGQHQVITQNIANVNTPGFRTLRLSFPEVFRESDGSPGELMARSADSRNLSEEAGLSERPDGNNVSMERELGLLGKNALLHRTFSEMLSVEFDAYRRAIQLR
ncbi:MAG: flagellar basal body rod protein FlgB [Planctomycetaceae bacterium]|nr:flagellar basal body rod protein FlgB [Planctomycetaceae bacterium]